MTLDFLEHLSRKPKQLFLLDDKDRPHMARADEMDISAFFASLTEDEIKRHKNVWQELRPKNEPDRFLRWLFAFCSVHTNYQSNMAGYNMIKEWYEWMNRPEALMDRIKLSGMGLYNNRTKFLIQFAIDYWSNADFFRKSEDETWTDCRNRIVEKISGLGMAKVSFALEMIYTEECEVFCADTHLFQAYGLDQKLHSREYERIEKHWIQLSKIWNVPSAIARAIYWNRKKQENDCLYWAKVFKAKE